MNCKTCKHFRSDSYALGFGNCHCPKLVELGFMSDKTPETDCLVVRDIDVNGGFILSVGENFGCVHHDPNTSDRETTSA